MRKKPAPSLAESKLILLYLASGMPSGIEHDEIVRFNAECGWMLYFEMEQYLTELAEDALLTLRDAGGGRKLYFARIPWPSGDKASAMKLRASSACSPRMTGARG